MDEFDHRLGLWTAGKAPGVFRGWARQHLQRMRWRFSWMEDQDLDQHGYLVFLTVCRKYPDIHEPKHLMALFKTSLRRSVHNLSVAKSALETPWPVEWSGCDEHGVVRDVDIPGDGEAELGVSVRLATVSHNCQKLLHLLIHSDPVWLREHFVHRMVVDKQTGYVIRETTNEMACRLLGLVPTEQALTDEIRDALL